MPHDTDGSSSTPATSLTPHEQAAFRDLPRNPAPPAHLEDRITAALGQRGLLQPRRRQAPALRLAIAAAAVFLVFAGGVLVGRSTHPARAGAGADAVAAVDEQRYLLLLYGPGDEDAAAAHEAARVREYGDWARALPGRVVAGEKLDAPRTRVTLTDEQLSIDRNVSNPAVAPVRGYFVIIADNYEQALTLASTCPHARYGGTVEIRKIA